MEKAAHDSLDEALKGEKFERRIRRRNFFDRLWTSSITVGGISIIGSVLLIMFFLFYVVGPLFIPAHVEQQAEYRLPGSDQEKTLYYGIDEYKETALRITDKGNVIGFNFADGQVVSEYALPLAGEEITSFTRVNEGEKTFAFGLSNGSVLFAKYGYKVTYPNDVRTIDPAITFPFGEEPIKLVDGAIELLAARSNDSQVMIAVQGKGEPDIRILTYDKTESMLSDEITLEESSSGKITNPGFVDWLMLGGSMRNLYLVQRNGKTQYYDISELSDDLKPLETVSLTNQDSAEEISTISFLLGEYSLMVGTSTGRVLQWFPVRGEDNVFRLKPVRSFEVADKPVEKIAIEHARKGFATIDAEGNFNLYNSTAERHLKEMEVGTALSFVEISERADGALVETQDGRVVNYSIENEHPDVSVSSLWGKVHYEGYSEPSYTWQSSSASSDFEPKLSLVPLTFGTIKAAFYSMLFAVPIAILGAIYVAFFMEKKSRKIIKPAIELIEALPTVILGFLAGLWLAPMMEANLAAFFSLLIIIPLGVMTVGYLFSLLPEHIRLLLPIGKRAYLMIPVVLILGWISFALNTPLENLFFDGDMRHWLTISAGIDFDQRNAMVIGFAMGFALIPTIFSVAEDAIYNVPSYLVNGSLALGASGWQTMVGVVLPTASPGIFSAVMLGFGRGIGETMIVLMASGNTPLMDANLFQGMRTLSANLAVEMPEAELYSSHYRVLFLSGLVLFIFTFVINTLAEVVRERMRRKYGSL